MAGYGGERPGAGRPRGRRNRRTRETTAAAERGITPLDYLLSVMRNPKSSVAIRIDAAKAAAPYVHPRLSQVDVQANSDLHGLTYDQIQQELVLMLKDPEVAEALGLDSIIERQRLSRPNALVL